MAVTSIVDYLKSQGQDSSYSARKKLAEERGITNYSGTAAQNTQLLNMLRNSNTQPSTAVTSAAQGSTPETAIQIPSSPSTTVSTKTSIISPTDLTASYKQKMTETEDNRPSPYESAYEGTIQDILDSIYNRKAFDINSDANYSALYDNYKERYMNQARRAMDSAMASANAATGGYGSTYGQAVGQQAYDATMEGLNDRNLDLMQLAYNMYSNDIANDYNKLSAFQNQDQYEYGQYRDKVNDWLNDRNYYANRYDSSFQNANAEYQSALQDALNLASSGMEVPAYLTETIDRYNNVNGLTGSSADTMRNIAAQAIANAASKAAGSRSPGNKNDESDDYQTEGELININTANDIYNYTKDRETGIEALDEAYWNYYSGLIKSSNEVGKKQALSQIMNQYMRITGITDSKLVQDHFNKVIKNRSK